MKQRPAWAKRPWLRSWSCQKHAPYIVDILKRADHAIHTMKVSRPPYPLHLLLWCLLTIFVKKGYPINSFLAKWRRRLQGRLAGIRTKFQPLPITSRNCWLTSLKNGWKRTMRLHMNMKTDYLKSLEHWTDRISEEFFPRIVTQCQRLAARVLIRPFLLGLLPFLTFSFRLYTNSRGLPGNPIVGCWLP